MGSVVNPALAAALLRRSTAPAWQSAEAQLKLEPAPAPQRRQGLAVAPPETSPEPVSDIEPEPPPVLPEAPSEPAPDPEDDGNRDDVTVSSAELTLTPYERAKAAMELARQRARQPRPVPEPPVRKPQRTPLEEVVARAESALDPLEGLILVEEKALPIGQRRVYRKMAFALQRAQEHLLRIRELAAAPRD
jgi:hypothetical protein